MLQDGVDDLRVHQHREKSNGSTSQTRRISRARLARLLDGVDQRDQAERLELSYAAVTQAKKRATERVR